MLVNWVTPIVFDLGLMFASLVARVAMIFDVLLLRSSRNH